MKNHNIKKDLYLDSDKKCFILGTGPSISDTPLHLLENHVTIGVNLILNSGFIPNYICVSDRDMINDNYDMIISDKMNNGGYLIAKPKHINTLHKLNNLNNVRMIDGFKEKGNGLDGVLSDRKPFIDEKLEKFAMTKNGVINDLAVSFAIYLGFKEIYLLGVDGQHGANTHFYDQKASKDKIDSIVREEASDVTYKLLLPILKKNNIKVYNCSVNKNKHPELQYKDLLEILGG
tara:strand:- start:3055 stop:3753 length:699 start_codon:yes stop_codon:yes gene_type:complete